MANWEPAKCDRGGKRKDGVTLFKVDEGSRVEHCCLYYCVSVIIRYEQLSKSMRACAAIRNSDSKLLENVSLLVGDYRQHQCKISS